MNSELTRTHSVVSIRRKQGGPDSAGQSGDTQGLPDREEGDSESVEELLEEGQSFEAEAILGVQDAPDADVAEVHTKQVREDDVPPEYLDEN
jgi:N utilization substance protein A